jgi:hypothetical protein
LRDAVGVVGLEFTPQEQQRASELAAELKVIPSNAKKRQRETFHALSRIGLPLEPTEGTTYEPRKARAP